MLRKEDPRFIRGTGPLLRRHPASRHAAHGHTALSGGARPHRERGHQRGGGPSQGQGGRDRRDPGRKGPGLDADAVQRRAGGAGHRQGPLPGPRGRLRRRRGPLLGPRRAGAHRGRVRHPRAGHRRPQGARSRDAGHPRRPRGEDRQPLLRLGDRRRGRHQRGLRVGRRRRQPGHRLPPGAPGTDGDLRLRGRLRAGRRQADAVDDLAGSARPPHGLRAGVGPARAQDPGDRPRYRRWLRQQGADLPGLRLRHRGLAGPGQAGQVDGGPLGEPDQHRLRPRLHHARRDRGHQGRQDPGHPDQRAGRSRRLQRHGGAGEVPGRLLRRVHRQLRPRGGLLQDDRRLYQQGPRRRGLRLLVPDHRGGLPRRAHRRLPGLSSSRWTRPSCG